MVNKYEPAVSAFQITGITKAFQQRFIFVSSLKRIDTNGIGGYTKLNRPAQIGSHPPADGVFFLTGELLPSPFAEKYQALLPFLYY